ncbi:hypothetical protein K438DRAFT_1883788, partial [Mycena galopus ATCC 62051]
MTMVAPGSNSEGLVRKVLRDEGDRPEGDHAAVAKVSMFSRISACSRAKRCLFSTFVSSRTLWSPL